MAEDPSSLFLQGNWVDEATTEAKSRILKEVYKIFGRKQNESERQIKEIKQSKTETKGEERLDSIQNRQSLSEIMLQSKMDSGNALGGVLMTSHLEDQLVSRKNLLSTHYRLNIFRANIQEENTEVFFSKYQSDNYEQSIKCGLKGVGNEVCDQKYIIEEGKESYVCTIKSLTMHIATTTPEHMDFLLSAEAMKDLHSIMAMYLAESDVHEMCTKFFSDYGSHFNLGPYNFGGHFLWKCSSKGFNEMERPIVMNMQEDIISAKIDSTFPTLVVSNKENIDQLKILFLGKCSKDVLESTTLEVKIIGGPIKAKSLSQWKDGLLQSNDTCVLIDRGYTWTPIWNIVDVGELGVIAKVLKLSWEKMTNLNHISFIGQQIMKSIKDEISIPSPLHEDLCSSDNNTASHDVLHQLKLCQYYHKKLTLQNALCVGLEPLKLSIEMSNLSSLEQLPKLVLHKLMSYDSRCRSDLIPDSIESSEDDATTSDIDSDEENDSNKTNSQDMCGIHPVDILLAILLCSDAFLLQDLFSRFAKCQLALPFVFPDPFKNCLKLPLWALRSVIKEWKTVENDEKVEHIDLIIEYPMPIVTFIRFGKHQKYCPSKSKIINQVINDNDDGHSYFFHRDCHGGHDKCILGEGLVDMTWYIPSEVKSRDGFPEPLTFLNLHGEAKSHMRQSMFLAKISSICFVMLAEQMYEFSVEEKAILDELNSSPAGITFLDGADQKSQELKKEYPKSANINLTDENAYAIKKKIRKRIRNKLQKTTQFKSIEAWCSFGKDYCIICDESRREYEEGHCHAEKVCAAIKDRTECYLKDTILPLQGNDLWKKWALYDKELHRVTQKRNKSLNEYIEEVNNEKNKIRKKQRGEIVKMTPTSCSQLFMNSLLELKGSSTSLSRTYFIQCLKLKLNFLSSKIVFEKQNKYYATRKTLSDLQSQCGIESQDLNVKTHIIKQELESLQNNITESAIGLEHLLREVGQVYEASIGQTQDKKYSHLPRAAAELFIEGLPLELMDGDAVHVPLVWVTAVLDEAVKILDDPKIYVFSVLGHQSTGKSTMLNTTFGLQFNVSKGRCTRGAFMQLVPTDEKLKNKTGCSYILVIDTEGLRAPELDPEKTQKHDNELATFVIGLANMTLINIYGAITGDMDDILQTSVHAFLRMSEVKYHPSCKFVHHNAGPSIKQEVGHARLTQKLNQYSVDAAKVETMCKRKIDCFNDVIIFNDQTDIHYFPGLWKGDPPMAPVNQGYSHAAQSLKYELVHSVCGKKGIKGCTYLERSHTALSLSSFKVKLQDLWNSLLKENFVFGFKNTLEISAYIDLELGYSHWDWDFQTAMMKWEQTAEDEISTEPIGSVDYKVKLKVEESKVYVWKVYTDLKFKMEEFFNGKRSEIMAQWKNKFELKLEALMYELQSRAHDQCQMLLNNQKAISKFEEEREKTIEYMKEQIQTYIRSKKMEQIELQEKIKSGSLKPEQFKYLHQRGLFTEKKLEQYLEENVLTKEKLKEITTILKDNLGEMAEEKLKRILILLDENEVSKVLTEDGLEEKFDEIWSSIISEKPQSITPSIKKDVEQALIKYVGSNAAGYLIGRLSENTLEEWGKWNDKHECKMLPQVSENIISVINQCFSRAKEHLEVICQRESKFYSTYVNELLQVVDDEISANHGSCGITPGSKYHIYLIVCGFAISKFERMSQHYEEKMLKIPLFVIFKNQYRQTKAEEAIADSLCAYLEEPIRLQVERKLRTRMSIEIRTVMNYFSNKMALKVKILTDLFEEKDFFAYRDYLENTSYYLEKKVKHYASTYCDEIVSPDEITRLQNAAIEEMSKLIEKIEDELSMIEETNINQWLNIFCNNIKSHLGTHITVGGLLCNDESVQQLSHQNLQDKIKEGLSELVKKLQQSFKRISYTKLNWKNMDPHKTLGAVIGCTEHCPFCGEQCDYQKGHEQTQPHRTEVHRMDCLAKWRWTKNRKLSYDFCPAQLGSDYSFRTKDGKFHLYKDYKSVYESWEINPDVTSNDCLYWKRFIAHYGDCLADEYHALPPETPLQWYSIKWEDIKKNLKEVYKL